MLVEVCDGCVVGDVDQGCVVLVQLFVEMLLVGVVQGVGCFVEDGYVWCVYQQLGEGQVLLFVVVEQFFLVFCVVQVVWIFGQMVQLYFVQYFEQGCVIQFVVGVGIDELVVQ